MPAKSFLPGAPGSFRGFPEKTRLLLPRSLPADRGVPAALGRGGALEDAARGGGRPCLAARAPRKPQADAGRAGGRGPWGGRDPTNLYIYVYIYILCCILLGC